ncbi:MAG TPA: hypothetical protein VNT31_12800 [Nocardioides sp.]|nr:hypothetical protein [Nocardioides sp.]
MRPQSPVLVTLDDGVVPGLVLKVAPDGQSVLVTYEEDGRVSTGWMQIDKVGPAESQGVS